MKSTELYVSGRTLDYGIQQFTFNVNVSDFPVMNASQPIYVEITKSNIMVNLVPYGTSVITSGYRKDLKLDPGSYSTNPDSPQFIAHVNATELIFFKINS